jgi:hypothetical protein
VIENMDVISYLCCGASYLEAKTLDEIDRNKLYSKSFARQRAIDVAAFAC